MRATRTHATFIAVAHALLASCVTTGAYHELEDRLDAYKAKAEERHRAAEQAMIELEARDQGHRQAIDKLLASAPLTQNVVNDLARELAARPACTSAARSSLVRAAPTLPTTSAPGAAVALIVLGDLTSPLSKSTDEMLVELRRTYGDRLQLTFVHDPRRSADGALRTARAAVAAGMQGRFWDLRDRIYAGHRSPGTYSEPSPADLHVYAVALGLDLAAFDEDMGSARVADFVAKNQAIAEAVGGWGSPLVFVNGTALDGTQPRAEFEAVIEQELAAAQQAGRSGPAWIMERTKAHAPALYGYLYGGVAAPPIDASAARTPARVSGTVATVNGVPVSAETFYAKVDALIAIVKSMNRTVNPGEAESQVLGRVIDDALIAQAIAEVAVVVAQADIDARVVEWFGTRADEPSEGTAFVTVAQRIREERGLELLLDKQHRLTVTDAEARTAYDRQPGSYLVRASVHAHDIFIAVADKASPDAEQRALARAQEVRGRLVNGEDFAAVAKQTSEGPLAPLGGDMGFRVPARLGKQLADPVAKLAVGEVSQPIRTPAGYHLVEVTDRRAERQLSFEEAKPQIVSELQRQKASGEEQALIRFQKQKATIAVLPPALAKMYAASVALDARGDPAGPAGWEPVADDRIVYRVTVDPKADPIAGARDALVTLVVFSDFQFAANDKLRKTLDQVMAAYAGKVRLVYKALPAGSQTEYTRGQAAAEAALCGQLQGKFWPLYAKLFDNQRALEDVDLAGYVTAVGLDVPRWQACVDAHATKPLIDAHLALADHVTHRWATFINGRRIIGAAPFDAFKTIIDEELARAAALSDETGLEGQALYRRIIRDGEVLQLGQKVHYFEIDANTPVSGARDARIQVVVFGDFTSSHSARVAPILAEVQSHYSGDLAIVYKYFPRANARASEAALAATCAQEQGKFWSNHDRFYEDQWALENNDGAVRKNVSGVDPARFDECLASARYQVVLDMNRAEAKVAGVEATPTIFINGRRFSWPNWPDKEDFISVIDAYVVRPTPAL